MSSRRAIALLFTAIAAAVLLAGCGGGAGGSTQTGSGEVFVQSAGEIFLEPAGDAGPESFAGDALVFDHAVPSPTSLALPTTLPTLPGSPVQVASYLGGTPGLYGGSRSKLIADKDAQLEFLRANPDKAAAFCAALNADPTLRWSGGTQVTVDELAAYFAQLTPVLITRDIRVTNHGFRDGKPTARQSILQAGQYILVDVFGVPRARCECGNPLIPPVAIPTKPRYTGKPWAGFDPSVVIVVQAAAAAIESLVLIDVDTGQTFERVVGSSGGQDADRTTTTSLPPTTSSMSTTTTTAFGAGPVKAGDLNGLWAGQFTVTDVAVDPSSDEYAEGCDLSMLPMIVDQPMPTTLEITMDPGGRSGTAIWTIDGSSLSAEGGSDSQTLRFTYAGNVLTFDMSEAQAEGIAAAMTGVVSWMGTGVLTIRGSMNVGDSANGMQAEWHVTKQVIM